LVRCCEGSGPTITQPSPNQTPIRPQSEIDERKTSIIYDGGIDNNKKEEILIFFATFERDKPGNAE